MVVVLVIAALVAFAVFNSTVYFVGTSAGSVALFRGMPVAPLGVELYCGGGSQPHPLRGSVSRINVRGSMPTSWSPRTRGCDSSAV